jgi:hypothetical protein
VTLHKTPGNDRAGSSQVIDQAQQFWSRNRSWDRFRRSRISAKVLNTVEIAFFRPLPPRFFLQTPHQRIADPGESADQTQSGEKIHEA